MGFFGKEKGSFPFFEAISTSTSNNNQHEFFTLNGNCSFAQASYAMSSGKRILVSESPGLAASTQGKNSQPEGPAAILPASSSHKKIPGCCQPGSQAPRPANKNVPGIPESPTRKTRCQTGQETCSIQHSPPDRILGIKSRDRSFNLQAGIQDDEENTRAEKAA